MIKVNTYKMELEKDLSCPWCSKTLTAASGIDGGAPVAGDLSVCVYCSEILEFQDGPVVYKKFTEDEVKALPEVVQQKLSTMVELVRKWRRAEK